MKNTRKGFIVPILIAIIVVLVIGGAVYVYMNNKVETPASSISTEKKTANDIKQDATQNSVSNQTNSNLVIPVRPLVISLSPSSVPLLSGFKISGSNFNPLGGYVGNGWLTHSHVFVKITNSNGQTGILWEGGSQGGNTSTSNLITVPAIPLSICMISEVAAGGCLPESIMQIGLGSYSLFISVDGRGDSKPIKLTVTQGIQ